MPVFGRGCSVAEHMFSLLVYAGLLIPFGLQKSQSVASVSDVPVSCIVHVRIAGMGLGHCL